MTDLDPPTRRPAPEPPDQAIRRSWWVLSGSFILLGLVAFLRIGSAPAPIDWLVVALLIVGGAAGLLHRDAVRGLESTRRAEAESFARILQGLSRSVSPDAIVGAIVEELNEATRADHVVVVRRPPGTRILEATLVSRSPGVPSSSTLVPYGDLDAGLAAGDTDQQLADRLAARVGGVYGLKHLVAAPLRTTEGTIGAIVLSRRTADAWTPGARRLLDSAAVEASAALARAQSHRAAETLASTDALTGLPNRRYFDEFCSLLGRRRRAEDTVGVLMIDIDHFKDLNDRHGHAVGDAVLRAVAQAIGNAVREQDVPARYGGEEFAVILRKPSRDVAMEVAERVRGAVGAVDLAAHGVEHVSVSVGAAVAEGSGEAIEAVIARADRALYAAKDAGRDRVIAA